jgi:hypothetical protein
MTTTTATTAAAEAAGQEQNDPKESSDSTRLRNYCLHPAWKKHKSRVLFTFCFVFSYR